MFQNVMTRAYLQGLPDEYKQQIISMRIKPFVDMVRGHASAGKTSLLVFEHEYLRDPKQYPELTCDDFIAAFKKIFPDCDVSYQEKRQGASPGVQQKGILIDWS